MLSKLDGLFRRSQAVILERRLSGPRRFMQVVAGPRQVGKTTPLESWLRSPDETKIGKKKAGRFSRSRFTVWLIYSMTPFKRIARKENALGFPLRLAPP